MFALSVAHTRTPAASRKNLLAGRACRETTNAAPNLPTFAVPPFLLLTVVAVAIAAAKTVGAENVLEPSRYKPAEAGRLRLRTRSQVAGNATRTDADLQFQRQVALGHRSCARSQRHLRHRQARTPTRTTPRSTTDEGIVADPAYRSLDIVMNPETKEFYSSKPPLMATLVAGEYWLLNRAFGWDIVRDRWLVIPTIVLTVERAAVRRVPRCCWDG